MTVKPGNYYTGKIMGEFFLKEILRVDNAPVFVVVTHGDAEIKLSLSEMKEGMGRK